MRKSEVSLTFTAFDPTRAAYAPSGWNTGKNGWYH
jgi:hypothetical protein